MSEPVIFRSKAAMARALGVERNTVIGWSKHDDFPGGHKGPWKLSDVFRWRIDRAERRRLPEDDALLAGGDSPALERYRLARAQMAEIELERQRGSLVEREGMRRG